jgi:protein-S-isoprenylcysteine O-methyltransferase Ste14
MAGELGRGLADIAYLCWGVFAAAWILGAIYNVWRAPAAVERRSWVNLVPRWLLAMLAIFVLLRLVPRVAWAPITFWNLEVALFGAALLIVSTLFALWARWTLGRMWSAVPTVKQHHELRTDGPYQITRHPIYTGILGMLLGSALMAGLGPALLTLVVFGAILIYRIPREEQLMTRTFGEQYVRYQHQVPRLVPFLRI